MLYWDSKVIESTQLENGMLSIECDNGWKYIVFPEELTKE